LNYHDLYKKLVSPYAEEEKEENKTADRRPTFLDE
jgi:hypothetical protein